ncbi:unnamed protein product (macronuclear) [Paramecium tetraurelia]|uniref:Cytosol aminopeptidase domain-containing protein n=1 Tax=Paramecium tetraurelia TaxID=5888 RepID=A0BF67_PARTE|nr:uncharacterized protein GSPATT00028219001 [Paramecium tetraurelia]CAK57184.1 unnamed protein product [Paramecium tetraurelia]|eukprot:XP_001424582.1 hypothetical protein (macronuclear) [Paramecium tetraurelia strain d4-2]
MVVRPFRAGTSNYFVYFVRSDSFRVPDVIQPQKGITLEILNTDAEQRLILADAMSYAQYEFEIQENIELSTLTGIIKNVLGSCCECLRIGRDDFHYYRQWRKSPQNLSEFCQLIKGSIAVINNSSSGKVGTSPAAAFLECFVEKKVRLLHCDVSSV